MALCWLTTLCAQEFGSHWIRIPQPDSLSHVWFRQTYVEDGLPLEARVTVASPGYYKLYVNECNVGTALFYPPRLQADSQPVAMTFDVTPFLRADTNVVALCYAPSYPHVDSSQVSVQFFGVDALARLSLALATEGGYAAAPTRAGRSMGRSTWMVACTTLRGKPLGLTLPYG